MRFAYVISVALLAIGMAGCVPFPHTVALSPEISGVVEDAGKPVEGTSVFLATGPEAAPCDTVIQAVSTAGDGSFVLPPRSQLRLFYAPLVAPVSVSEFTFCVRSERGVQMGYRGVTWQSEAGAIELRCDPSRPLQLRRFDGISREVICEARRAAPRSSKPVTAADGNATR